jgi:hypothetical protein
MRQPQYTLTRDHVHAHASYLLRTHLRLRDYGRCCPVTVLLTILFAAAARLSSLFATCKRLLHAPSAETVRQALATNMPTAAELQRRLNRTLQAHLPRALRQRPQHLAIDLLQIPYYGKPKHSPDELCRGRPKAGTSRFHTYATAYVIRKGRRYTLALTDVQQGDATDAIVRRLLQLVAKTGIRAKLVLLDRGFFSVPVVRYLQAARQPFVILMPCRGRRPDQPGGPGSTQKLCYQKRSGWHTYSWRDKKGRAASVSVGVRVTPRGRAQARRKPLTSGQGRRQARKPPGRPYAFWGWQPSSYEVVSETYRSRFAIETSYRQLHQGRLQTSTRDPLQRLLFVGIALVLRNVWVWLHDAFLAERRRGGRVYHLERLRFRALLCWLADVADQTFGILTATVAEVIVTVPLPPP